MDSPNVDLVKRSFDAMRRGDVEGLLELYDDDVSFLPLTGTQVETGGYRGHDGVRAYMAEVLEVWDQLWPCGEQYIDLGDRVVVLGACKVRGRSSGVESDSPCAWVVQVSEGRIGSHRTCRSYEEALELAAHGAASAG